MSYGKYGFKPIANRGEMPGSFAGRAYQDPVFAGFEALGRVLSNNYAERGTNAAAAGAKADLEAEFAAPPNPQAMLDAYNAGQGQDQASVLNPVNPQLVGANPQLPVPDGSGMSRENMPEVGAFTKLAQDLPGRIAAADQASVYTAPLEALYKRGASSFNADRAMEILNKRIAERGLVGDEKARFMEMMTPVMNQYQRRYTNDLNTKSLAEYKSLLDKGDYEGARSLGLGLMQDSPQLAGAMLNGVPTPKDTQVMGINAQRIAMMNKNLQYRAEQDRIKGVQMENKASYAAMDNEIKNLQGSLKYYKENYMDENGNWLSPAHKEEYNRMDAQLRALNQSRYGIQPNVVQTKKEFDGWNDYNQIGEWANKQLDQGKNPEEVYKVIMANTDMGANIVSALKSGRQNPAILRRLEQQAAADGEEKKKAEEAEAVKQARINSPYVNPYTGKPYSSNPWFDNPNKK